MLKMLMALGLGAATFFAAAFVAVELGGLDHALAVSRIAVQSQAAELQTVSGPDKGLVRLAP
jgi:hypothetical protein